jgi:hypothetical protein
VATTPLVGELGAHPDLDGIGFEAAALSRDRGAVKV